MEKSALFSVLQCAQIEIDCFRLRPESQEITKSLQITRFYLYQITQ